MWGYVGRRLLLAIPHFIVLLLLFIAFVLLTIVAFFAILFGVVEAAKEGDVFISVTGNRDAIAAPMFAEMKPIPVIQAGNDRPDRKKSRDDLTARFRANPMPPPQPPRV